MTDCKLETGNLSRVPGVDKCLLGSGGRGAFKQSVSQLPHLQIMHKPLVGLLHTYSASANVGGLSFLVSYSRVSPYMFNVHDVELVKKIIHM